MFFVESIFVRVVQKQSTVRPRWTASKTLMASRQSWSSALSRVFEGLSWLLVHSPRVPKLSHVASSIGFQRDPFGRGSGTFLGMTTVPSYWSYCTVVPKFWPVAVRFLANCELPASCAKEKADRLSLPEIVAEVGWNAKTHRQCDSEERNMYLCI